MLQPCYFYWFRIDTWLNPDWIKPYRLGIQEWPWATLGSKASVSICTWNSINEDSSSSVKSGNGVAASSHRYLLPQSRLSIDAIASKINASPTWNKNKIKNCFKNKRKKQLDKTIVFFGTNKFSKGFQKTQKKWFYWMNVLLEYTFLKRYFF